MHALAGTPVAEAAFVVYVSTPGTEREPLLHQMRPSRERLYTGITLNRYRAKHKFHREVSLANAFGSAISPLSLSLGPNAIAGRAEEQVCDVGADYSLGVEDYSETIRRHLEVLREHPDNALAHYHLGFALGMLGERMAKIKEYQRAAALGLRNWN